MPVTLVPIDLSWWNKPITGSIFRIRSRLASCNHTTKDKLLHPGKKHHAETPMPQGRLPEPHYLLSLNSILGPVHTGRGAPRNRRTQILEHIIINGSVHTGCKQHQKVCTQIGMQICLRVLCERGLTAVHGQCGTCACWVNSLGDPWLFLLGFWCHLLHFCFWNFSSSSGSTLPVSTSLSLSATQSAQSVLCIETENRFCKFFANEMCPMCCFLAFKLKIGSVCLPD